MPKSASSGARDPENVPDRLPPARSRERRVQQLVGLAENLVEERLRLGTASPTEVTAVLRYGSALELANIERVKMHTQYLGAQKAKAEAETVQEDMFQRAMDAVKKYRGDEG